ncbi:myomegalin-like, partial [Lontra canadensis]|uniref:myomegalin-like n=1 Tax=Lontra canadensis TaxID=76717 RepID=UPI0013F34F8D
GQSLQRELLELRTRLSKQESVLQNTAEHLKLANQQKESMQQFIFNQLTRTHDVLKKARTNLEAKSGVRGKQEPRKKRSHWRSFKQQEDWACPPLVQILIC